MQTPNTEAGRITEKIMSILGSQSPLNIKLDTTQYNKIYSHVLTTLNNNLGKGK